MFLNKSLHTCSADFTVFAKSMTEEKACSYRYQWPDVCLIAIYILGKYHVEYCLQRSNQSPFLKHRQSKGGGLLWFTTGRWGVVNYLHAMLGRRIWKPLKKECWIKDMKRKALPQRELKPWTFQKSKAYGATLAVIQRCSLKERPR